jgi:hypothetical protein
MVVMAASFLRVCQPRSSGTMLQKYFRYLKSCYVRNVPGRHKQRASIAASAVLTRGPAQEFGNSYFRRRGHADIDSGGSVGQNGPTRCDFIAIQTRSAGTANTYPTPRSV